MVDTEWTFTLLPRLWISGHVTGLDGRVARVEATEVDPAFETFFGSPSRSLSGMPHSTETAADGSFKLRGLQPGWYEVMVYAGGSVPEIQRVEVFTKRKDVHFSLRPGLTFAGRLSAGFAVKEGSMSVDLDPDPLFRSLFGGPVVKNDGSFRFEDLAPGTYELQVALNPAGKGRNPVRRVYRLQLEESVLDFQRVVSKETATVKIRASSALSQGFASGRLTARGEHGFLERVVRLYPPGRRRNHGTWEISDSVFNASGSFHYNSAFTLELEAGEWELALNIAGFEPWSMRMAAQGALELNALSLIHI